jgi:hypothetical protein
VAHAGASDDAARARPRAGGDEHGARSAARDRDEPVASCAHAELRAENLDRAIAGDDEKRWSAARGAT